MKFLDYYNKFWNKVTLYLKNSFLGKIIAAVIRFFRNLYESSVICAFFTKSTTFAAASKSKIAKFFRYLFDKSAFANMVRQSKILDIFIRLGDIYFALPISALGAYMLAVMVCPLMMFFNFTLKTKIIIISLSCISILLLFVKNNIKTVLYNSFIGKKIIDYFELISNEEKIKNIPAIIICFVLGLIVSASFLILPMKFAILIALGIMILPLILTKPFLLLCLSGVGAMFLPTLVLDVLCIYLFMMAIIWLIFKKLPMPKANFLFILTGVYGFIILVFTFINYGGASALQGGFIKLAILPIFYAFAIIIDNRQKLIKFLKVFITGAMITGIYGIYQYFSGSASGQWVDKESFGEEFMRAYSTFGNPNVYGEFLLVAITIAFALIIISKLKKEKIYFSFCFVILLLSLALTYSRGCYVALVIAVLIMVWYFDKRLLIFLAIALLLSPMFLPQSILTRITSITNLADSSTSYRISIWQGSFEIVRNLCYIGAGMGKDAFNAFYQFFMLGNVTAQHSHNTIFQIIIELSLAGYLIFALMNIFVAKDTMTSIKTTKSFTSKVLHISVFAGLIALMFQGLFDYIFFNNKVYMVTFIAFAILYCLARFDNEESEKIKDENK